ncbi:hypothetical protein AN958_00924 [Leucoagaricus sp. SymC.cos]|nr:hypothetical protein AN958_00924 [Leucoagaricus sp. SymC.cos]
MLSSNLCHSLTFKNLPTLPALIDYHDSYPQYRSTDSYNFLIELSIRHAQFGTTHWLLDAMIHDRLPRDLTTRILEVRWLVRTGKWETAWTRVTGLRPEDALDKPLRNGLPSPTITVPCEMWKELLGTTKRGAIRRRSGVRRDPDKESNDHDHFPPLEIVDDPAVGTKAYVRRRHLLGCLRPTFTSSKKLVRPKLVNAAVSHSLRNGEGFAAEALAHSYLSQLPSKVRDETAAQCMDIIHTLLKADIKCGLKSFRANQGRLMSLLTTHPSLKPSSTTLRLILLPLQSVFKSGTIANDVAGRFQKHWGDQIIDNSVKSLIVKLAEKEGRMDIVEKMLHEERCNQRMVRTRAVPQSTLPLPDPRGLRRPPDRELFSCPISSNILWDKLKARVRRKQRADNQERVE